MDKLKNPIFFQLTKINLDARTVEGIATAEIEDSVGETCHYETTKPYFEKWSKEVQKASGGKSLGNVRAMHSNIAAGILTEITFDDAAKSINVVAEIVDDAEWKKCVKGVYTGFSQGGSYVKVWKEDGKTFFTADPGELSIVDMPCLGVSTFKAAKSDGTFEMVKFAGASETAVDLELEQVWKAKDGSLHAKKADASAHNEKLAAEAANEPAALFKKHTIIVSEIAKGTWDASQAINALCSIEWLMFNEQCEQDAGVDQGTQLSDLQTAIDRLKTFIASEITEDMKADGTLERIKKTISTFGLAEKFAKLLQKEKVETMDAESAKKLAALTDENASLTKQLGDLTKSSTDSAAAMREQLEALNKRLATVEAQPVPPKGKISATTAVEKGHEVTIDQPVEAKSHTKSAFDEQGLSPAELRARRRNP